MKWSGSDSPADCIQGVDVARILASCELVLLVEQQGVEALAVRPKRKRVPPSNTMSSTDEWDLFMEKVFDAVLF